MENSPSLIPVAIYSIFIIFIYAAVLFGIVKSSKEKN
jgi:hypothetical protein